MLSASANFSTSSIEYTPTTWPRSLMPVALTEVAPEGPVSVAAGVVYGCDMEYNPANPALGAGQYFALDTSTGKPIWSTPTIGIPSAASG